MRVLFITGEFPPMQGGVGDCTKEIAQALAATGVQVCVLTSARAAGDTKQNSPLRVLPSIRHWGWSSLSVIRQTIRTFAADLVHVQFQTAAFGMHPAIYFGPRLVGATKCGITFHDLKVPYLFPKAGPVREWITRSLARAGDAVIATNGEDYRELETWNLKHLTLIPIGSNIATTAPPDYNRTAWRTQLGVAEHDTLLCYFGFLNESKGGETLVRALALVPNTKLLMIGGQVGASDPTNASYLARVKRLIAELGLTERVLWTDYTPSQIVTANFVASDLCVLPYRDGASFRHGTLMAALAHGCALITTQPPHAAPQTGILPRLRDGANCLLVPPDDPKALAKAIERAISSPALRSQIGVGARALAAHFSWERIAQQHLELYRNMLA